MNRNDWLGVLCYFALSAMFGAGVGMVCLFVKENSDRIAYYDGKWNKGDLVLGVLSVLAGWAVDMAVRWWIV